MSVRVCMCVCVYICVCVYCDSLGTGVVTLLIIKPRLVRQRRSNRSLLVHVAISEDVNADLCAVLRIVCCVCYVSFTFHCFGGS